MKTDGTMQQRRAWERWIVAARVILLLAPPLWAAALVGRYGVDLPWADQWAGECPLFEKTYSGTLAPHDFLAPFHEHRILFPRLVFYALDRATHWNVWAELWTILGLTLAIALNLWRMLRDTRWRLAGTGFWLFLAADVLVFSPLHHENLLWGFQIGFLLPLACMTACLWVGRVASVPGRFLGVFGLSVVCSFSVAGGFACWLIGLPLLAQTEGKGSWRKHRRWWIAWGMGFVGSIVLYYRGYATPLQPVLRPLLLEPTLGEKFWFAYLGQPFALGTLFDPMTLAWVASAMMFLPLVAALGYLWRWQEDEELSQRCQPWLLLIAVALWNDTITTVGRACFGKDYALTSRYAIFAVFMPIGLSFVCATIHRHLRSRASPSAWAGNVGVVLMVIGSVLGTLHLLAACHVALEWQTFSHGVRQAKALAETIDIVDETELVVHNLSTLDVRDKLHLLDRIGYLRPPLLRSNEIGAIADVSQPPAQDAGRLEWFGNGRDLRFRIRGWAVLPPARRPADAVLLTYDDARGHAIIFALAEVGSARDDVVELWQDTAYLHCGWEKVIRPDQLPTGAGVIKAWSFDTETARAYRLPGQAIVPESKLTPAPTAR